ncbi:MAG: YerC/YecD family TrpR-related protein [Lachnospiraceae bacterium]|jgi:TrpR-related protein YerC/YecD|nr:YerC/YecD family TrpR-related protein [Lachnospiraceae bacterium]MDD7326969.1 YerC/YecD family TrpR-related protein [Lachnospiraceae bacterium]MDY2759997.1 YerC/YecD family TrpR-related protein [Lachnospiraceae bacterium]
MSKNLHTPEMDRLMDALLSLGNRDEAYSFMEDLCTVGELEAMQQRLSVASMLRTHETYQKIAEDTGASTATISRVKRALEYGDDGYELVLKRIEGV